MKTLSQKLKEMSPARRKKIAARAAQLLADEMSLRELRHAHKLTQERIAETLWDWARPSFSAGTAH